MTTSQTRLSRLLAAPHTEPTGPRTLVKRSAGGLCIYINNSWCTNVTVMKELCSPEAELNHNCRKTGGGGRLKSSEQMIGSETVDVFGDGGTWLVHCWRLLAMEERDWLTMLANVGDMLTMEERDWFWRHHVPHHLPGRAAARWDC